jgi:Mg2+ and Co2+ transporter CorA
MARLRQPDTGLRASADPSLLVQSLLDLIVDSALEVVDAFHEKILQLEYDVLMKPNMKVVSRRAGYSPVCFCCVDSPETSAHSFR